MSIQEGISAPKIIWKGTEWSENVLESVSIGTGTCGVLDDFRGVRRVQENQNDL